MINLKEKVEYCLKKYPTTRNDDVALTIDVWWEYHREYLKKIDGEYYVKCKDLKNLPREDNVKRVRAIIQNKEHKYLPTSLEVAKKRKINEEAWLNYIRQENLNISNPAY